MGQGDERVLRVLAADDSAVMRSVIGTVFELHGRAPQIGLPAMELCGVVRDGIEALEAVARLRPDVLLLDLEMPRLGGIGVLERLRKQMPELPVIMCSAHTERGARSTLEAMAHGAKDYVMKPGQQTDFAAALDLLMQQLLPKIAASATGRSDWRSAGAGRDVPAREMAFERGVGKVEVVVIGVSTGGPSALEAMLPLLPATFAAPVLIVQHMPKLFTGALAVRLARVCGMPVREAQGGESVLPGTIWLAPGDAHMEVANRFIGVRAGGKAVLRLHQGANLNGCKPAADYLFQSAAKVFGEGTLAVVMTGMGSDGLEGARAVRQAGGTVFAQNKASSAVWGMPGRVAQAGLADEVLPLSELAGALMERTGVAGAFETRNGVALPSLTGRGEVRHGLL